MVVDQRCELLQLLGAQGMACWDELHVVQLAGSPPGGSRGIVAIRGEQRG